MKRKLTSYFFALIAVFILKQPILAQQLQIGDTYQGGIVFYLDSLGGGLIAAPTDQSSGAEWGCYGTNIPGASGTAIGSGAQNTIDIVNANCSPYLNGNAIAANICDTLTFGGFSDWFLPSREELFHMYLNIGQGNALGLGNIGGFANNYGYWSSTEYNYNSAWGAYFSIHVIDYVDKTSTIGVRAVRTFSTVSGCTDSTSYNYDNNANIDDGSCLHCNYMNSDYISDISFSDISCVDANDGAIYNIDLANINITGFPPFLFSVDSGLTFQYSNNFSNLSSGDYYVTYMDDNGCINPNTSNFWLPLLEPDTFNYTVNINNVSCVGRTDGSIDLVTINVSSPSFLWSNGSINQSIDFLAQGHYNLTITDSDNCSETIDFNIDSDGICGCTDSLAFNYNSSANVEDSSCIAIVYGCMDSLQFNFNSFANIQLSGSCIPFYYGCTDTSSFNYDSNANTEDFSCIPVIYGCIDIFAFNYDSFANTDNGSCIGFINGCTDSTAYNFNESANTNDSSCLYCNYMNNDYISDISYSDVTCFNGNDGSIYDIDLGNILIYGVSPFSYSIDSGLSFQPSNSFYDLPSEDYYITYKDGNGCINPNTSLFWMPLYEPSNFQYSSIENPISCSGGDDGSITLQVLSGNTSPYNISWSNGITGNSTYNLSNGAYDVIISDNNLCLDTLSFFLLDPLPLGTVANINDITCTGLSDGSASISAFGGTPPYTYTWNNGQIGNTALNLNEGEYEVYTLDSANCLDTNQILIGSNPINITFLQTNVSCSGVDGEIYSNISGGTAPYNSEWYFEYSGFGYINVGFGQNILNISSGNYFLKVTDYNGCVLISDTLEIVIDSVLISSEVEDISCFNEIDGSINIDVIGGQSPYYFNWSNGETTEDISNLSSGNYTLIITDSNNCSSVFTSYINEPLPLSLSENITQSSSCSASIDITAYGGIAPYSYLWQIPTSSIVDSFLVSSEATSLSHPYSNYSPFQVYEINGVQALEINLIRGETYYFNMNNIPFFQPFYISSEMFGGSSGNSFPALITNGVVNLSGTGSSYAIGNQTLSFTPNSSHSDTLYYQCGNFMYMGYRIIISDGNISEDLIGLCSGDYDLTLTDSNGCMFTQSYSLTNIIYGCTDTIACNYDALANTDDGGCNYPTTSFTFISDCDSYVWNGNTYIQTGYYSYSGFSNTSGCDSTAFLNLNLTISNLDTTIITTSICSGNSFTVGTNTYNTDGTYTDLLTTVDGCDSTVITNLTIDPLGCTDASAFNYDANAICDDGSCIAIVNGCTDPFACGYNNSANTDDGSCTYTAGCIDPLASNYNPAACINNGSCIYNIYGCTDSTAINFDPLANTDDGSCFLVVLGCTDSTAANFNLLANTDDGSCSVCADNYVNIQINTANYGSEVAWELVDDAGGIVASGGCQSFPGICYNSNSTYDNWLCIPTACYTLNLYDMFGDGWAGGTYAIYDVNGSTYAYGTLSNGYSSTTTDIGIPFCSVLGCTDPTATNYNALANTDDGSCYSIQCVEVLPYSDDLELGSSNNRITLTSGNNASSSLNGYAANDGNYGWHGESINVWGGGTPSSGQNAFNTKPDNIANLNVCVDLDAIVYNPSDVYHLKFDLKQEYSYNANYSWFRVQADNTVISDNNGDAYFQPNTPTSDSWQEIIYDVTSYVSMGVFDFDFQTCNKYSYGSFNNGDNGYVDNIQIYKVIYGCTDSTMYNYNVLANADNGTCEMYSYGCIDATATNYDVLANTDDGSCTNCYAVADIGMDTINGCDSVLLSTNTITNGTYLWNISTLSVPDIGSSYEGGFVFHYDSINGNGLIVANTNQGTGEWGCQGTYIFGADGTAIGTGQQNTLDIIAGCSTAGIAARLSDSYAITQNGITYDDWYLPSADELQLIRTNIYLQGLWQFINPNGNSVYLNGGYYYWTSTEDNGGSAICQQLYSSSQPHASKSISSNYAHSIRSFNFQLPVNVATTNSVIVSASGWNYVTVTDSLGCTATDSVYVNIQNCIYGCTDPTALNYNASATLDDGSCIATVYGCIDSAQLNYNVLANTDDGSCISFVYGCMDSTMFNYNALANTDDGYCMAIAYGCTDSLALNYNAIANTDDSTCCGASLFMSFGTQIGFDIDGEYAGDESGVSIASNINGSIVAVGSVNNSDAGSSGGYSAGHVRVYQNVNDLWVQMGQDLDGVGSNNSSGSSIDLDDSGTILVVGNPSWNNEMGFVSVYKWNGVMWDNYNSATGLWYYGEALGDNFGHSVSISGNGNIIAVGAPHNSDNGVNSGSVKVLEINENTSGSMNSLLQQIGQDIDGEAASDYSGYSVSLSNNGNTVAIGAQWNDGNGTDAGHVRIYNYNGSSWVQLGVDIDGEAVGDESGRAISLSSDGNTVAIAAWYNDGDNGYASGHVRIFNYNGTSWNKLGQDIDGEAIFDYLGYSVSLSSDGNTVAIGAAENDGNGNQSGHVRIYNWSGSYWTQLGQDIDGETSSDFSGYSVSLSGDGDIVAIGSPYNNGNGNNSGHVRVFSLGQYTSPPCSGCTDSIATNYDPYSLISDSSCTYAGCTNPAADNYDATATVDDGSCTYTNATCDAKPTGLNTYDITDTRFRLGWDNMNTSSCMVLKYNVRYREAATASSSAGSWTTRSAGAGNGLCNFGLNNVEKLMINFNPSTTYDIRMRVMYCTDANPSTGWSAWTSSIQVTTADLCPDLTNVAVQTFNGQTNKAKITWDSTGVYMFARLYTRVNVLGSPWTVQGGFGINYPTFYKNLFTFTPGETYRVQANSFCSSTMTSYRGTQTPPVVWTQPGGSAKIDGGTSINNLDIYPNPSRDIFNITFTSETIQDLRVRILNIVGEVVYTENLEQFVGEYTKQVDLAKYTKGVYFLEITTNNGIINKKLILQ